VSNHRKDVKLPSKIFLALAVAGIGIGLWVSGTGTQLHPIWTLALPLGVISLGMCFLTCFMQGPVAGYDEDQNRELSRTQTGPGNDPEAKPEHREPAPRRDGLTTGHVR
jgi:hypothetical protein